MKKLAFALLLALQTLMAQVVQVDNCVNLADDNPDWARQDFDDRQWSKDFPKTGSPNVWTRCRVDPARVRIRPKSEWPVIPPGNYSSTASTCPVFNNLQPSQMQECRHFDCN